MAVSATQAQLGIDFGTSNTVAMLALPGRAPTPLLFDGSPVLPSAVFASAGRLLVGRDAERAAMSDPASFEPYPKRCIADGSVMLGTNEYPVIELIAAVLRRVADEARRVVGFVPPGLALTHPAGWGSERLRILAAAAHAAGLPQPRLVPEPVAAATHFSAHLGHRIDDGAHVVVYDMGAGTFDVSAVRAEAGRIVVAATGGLSDVGGIDIDFAVVRHLEQVYPGESDQWQRLRTPSQAADRRHRRGLWRDVRDAKEILSRESSTALFIPVLDVDAHLTRDELENLARPLLEQTVALTLGVLAKAGIAMESVAGLFLVGGASRMPLSSTMLLRQTHKAPTVLEQPELVVAAGAIDAPGSPVPAADPHPVSVVNLPSAPIVMSQITGVGETVVPHTVFRGVAKVPERHSVTVTAIAVPVVSATGPISAPPPAPMTTLPESPPVEVAGIQGDPIAAVALCGTTLAVASGKAVVLCDVDAARQLSVRDGNDMPLAALAWSPEGDGRLATADGALVKLWHVRRSGPPGFDEDTPLRTVNCPGPVRLMSWTGGALAVGNTSEVLVWDPQTGECTRTWRFSGGPQEISELRALAWSPDGTLLAAGGSHGNIKIWDHDADNASLVLTLAPIGVRALAWSPGGEWLVSGDAAGGLRIWRLADRTQQAIAHAHDAAVQTVAWSPDGKLLASGSIDHTVKIWDAGSGREHSVLRGHTAMVTSLCWTPDSHRLVSGGVDGTVRLWDLSTGQQLYQLPEVAGES